MTRKNIFLSTWYSSGDVPHYYGYGRAVGYGYGIGGGYGCGRGFDKTNCTGGGFGNGSGYGAEDDSGTGEGYGEGNEFNGNGFGRAHKVL